MSDGDYFRSKHVAFGNNNTNDVLDTIVCIYE